MDFQKVHSFVLLRSYRLEDELKTDRVLAASDLVHLPIIKLVLYSKNIDSKNLNSSLF